MCKWNTRARTIKNGQMKKSEANSLDKAINLALRSGIKGTIPVETNVI